MKVPIDDLVTLLRASDRFLNEPTPENRRLFYAALETVKRRERGSSLYVRPAFAFGAIIAMLVLLLGLGGIASLVIQNNEAELQRQQTVAAILATNTSIEAFARATATAKSWTATAPLAIIMTPTPQPTRTELPRTATALPSATTTVTPTTTTDTRGTEMVSTATAVAASTLPAFATGTTAALTSQPPNTPVAVVVTSTPPRLFPTATVTARGTCPGFIESRLSVGRQARVIADFRLDLMDQPGGQQILGQVPGGASVRILDGPRCAANTAWWQVEYAGRVGWLAEGQGSSYWLEPLAESTATPTGTGEF